MPSSSSTRMYSGWQHEKVSFLLGLSGRRAALLGAAVFLGLEPIASGHLAGLVLIGPLAVLLAACAYVRVAGRTLDEWIITMVSFQLLKFGRRTSFLSGAFAPDRGVQAPRLDLPGVLAPLRILTATDGTGAEFAVLHHPQARTFTAIAVVGSEGLGLVEAERAESLVAAWGEVLASLCTENQPVARIQFVSRLVPQTVGALRSWHTEHLDPAAPLASVMANEALLAASAPFTARRHTWVAITLDARKAATAIRASGGGESGACRVLEQQVRALRPLLGGAGITVERWVDTGELSEIIRTGFDPASAALLDQRRADAIEQAGRGQACTA